MNGEKKVLVRILEKGKSRAWVKSFDLCQRPFSLNCIKMKHWSFLFLNTLIFRHDNIALSRSERVLNIS